LHAGIHSATPAAVLLEWRPAPLKLQGNIFRRISSGWILHSNSKRSLSMKRYAMMLTVLALLSGMAFAEDGAALYKSKCAMCHGAMGEGKIGPSLQKTSMTEKQIAEFITTGAAGKKAPHTKGVAGVTPDQATAVATYVAGLKK
jgi:cytochrome c